MKRAHDKKPHLAAGLVAAFALGTPAWANDVGAKAQALGLIGEWARTDCNQPASGENDFDNWSVNSDGTVSEVSDAGPVGSTRYQWTRLQRLAGGRIALDGTFLGDGHGQHVVIELRDGKQRTWSNHDTTDNVDLVAHAVILGNQQPSAWYVLCR